MSDPSTFLSWLDYDVTGAKYVMNIIIMHLPLVNQTYFQFCILE